jgi:hypothetical protein
VEDLREFAGVQEQVADLRVYVQHQSMELLQVSRLAQSTDPQVSAGEQVVVVVVPE